MYPEPRTTPPEVRLPKRVKEIDLALETIEKARVHLLVIEDLVNCDDFLNELDDLKWGLNKMRERIIQDP